MSMNVPPKRYPSQFDRVVWDFEIGESITATNDLFMEETHEQVFTANHRYTVVRIHPLRDPARLVVFDDMKAEHLLSGGDVLDHFSR